LRASVCRSDSNGRNHAKALVLRLEQKSLNKALYGWEDIPENDQADEDARHGEGSGANPIQIAPGPILAHQQHNCRAPIERRDGEKIEHAEKKIQRKKDKEHDGDEAVGSAVVIPLQQVHGCGEAKAKGAQKHKDKIRGGSGKGHHRRAMRVTPRPVRVVGRASKSDHAAIQKEKAQKRKDHHAVRGSANVRHRVERNLAAQVGRVIPAQFCRQSVSRFVACRREKKNNIVDEAEEQELGCEIWHKKIRLGFPVLESKLEGTRQPEFPGAGSLDRREWLGLLLGQSSR